MLRSDVLQLGLSVTNPDHQKIYHQAITEPVQLRNHADAEHYTYTYITFLVFRTRQGSQQTISGRILRMSTLNDTIHSMLF